LVRIVASPVKHPGYQRTKCEIIFPVVIKKILIEGYRAFGKLNVCPNSGMNIIVGDNETGKSTLLEGIGLALTGRLNGRWASEELNPFWFHQPNVTAFFDKFGSEEAIPPPEIEIELYLESEEPDVQRMRGVHNSHKEDCPGIRLHIKPADDYAAEFQAYMDDDCPHVLPTEYYEVVWKDFNDMPIRQRPQVLGVSFIDSRTIRSSTGVDYHTRQILGSFLDTRERAAVAVAHRKARHQITTDALGSVNTQMAQDSGSLHETSIGLAMDQSARASWESGVVPQVAEIPFAMIGQGQQAAIKVALAMRRRADSARFVLIEEPETHLSYSRLQRLIARIEKLRGDEQQIFVTTHSSYVLNRLGIDKLLLLTNASAARITDLSADTVSYFQRLSGYDTLRLVLANKLVLVEGPSDEMIFQRAFKDTFYNEPAEAGIDIVAMSGITFSRAFELCARLNRPVVALQDNDDRQPDEIREDLQVYLSDDRRMFVGDPSLGTTLEPQLIRANGVDRLKTVLGLRAQDDPATWMPNHKTEAALRILTSTETISFPPYIVEAVESFR
jgi:putative ATP-dependent endonuclease of OLD family